MAARRLPIDNARLGNQCEAPGRRLQHPPQSHEDDEQQDGRERMNASLPPNLRAQVQQRDNHLPAVGVDVLQLARNVLELVLCPLKAILLRPTKN